MLKRITIKNFRSLKDVTVDLQDVNLFIGPNNSGKTNFLKALEFIGLYYNQALANRDIKEFTFQHEFNWKGSQMENPISFIFEFEGLHGGKGNIWVIIELSNLDHGFPRINEFWGEAKPGSNLPFDFSLNNWQSFHKLFSNYELNALNSDLVVPESVAKQLNLRKIQQYRILKDQDGLKAENSLSPGRLFGIQNPNVSMFKQQIGDFLSKQRIYSPDVNSIRRTFMLRKNDTIVNSDASNLVSFLDNMRDENPDVIKKIEKDLQACIKEFKELRFLKVNAVPTELGKKWGLFDIEKKTYWVDELSDGVLYFIALLAIINQPSPPQLLILEEPEKGIHPRRISEVIDFILQLVETRGIQVILTTHSTQVLDEFKDLTEGVFVFEKESPETKIKNLQKDIIESTNNDLKKKKLPLISYRDGLGEHWAMGFIGGVPK